MVNINNNYDLYDKYTSGLEYAKKLIPSTLNNKLIINYYWRVPLEFSRKQLLAVKSALVANYELNKDNLEINLWSNVDLSNNEYLEPLKKLINIKIWDPIEEIKGTILEPYIDYYKRTIIEDSRNWIAGDFFRLLCLHKYGGFYFDMDVLILRDLSPLNNYEFLYQWGSSGTQPSEPNIFFNGAIMRLNKGSQASEKLIKETLSIVPAPETTAWSSTLYSRIQDNNLNYFPCAWFNTEWCLKTPSYNFDAFKSSGRTDLFEGAFTWHWHNKWNDEIEIGSKWQILEEKINKKFLKING